MEVHTKYNRTIKKKVSKFGRDFQKVLLMLEIITFKKKDRVCQEKWPLEQRLR